MRHTQHRCLGVPRCASVCEQQEEPLGQLQQEEPLGQLEEPLANSRLRVALSL